jgi:N-acetylneuraminic acid mutarotase
MYDTVTCKWSNFKLSAPHAYGVAVGWNGKSFLAGGFDSNDRSLSVTAAVDIYDVTTKLWSTANLSVPRSSPAAAAAGNKILFVDGRGDDEFTSAVDIYDVSTGDRQPGPVHPFSRKSHGFP